MRFIPLVFYLAKRAKVQSDEPYASNRGQAWCRLCLAGYIAFKMDTKTEEAFT